ncbi:ribonuclease HII [Poritiphilus flavus]|uniref:Ribonuclease HII n=1 Tax=Poritiphilus flavus TaxID=2697053 RepID=A0A6L9EJM7_9FLAO|nr:ribonuclease HII [Poritiphilus flavus]NAS14399.1 ribonuclease HII [Poritiphilus flavus]
MKYSILALLVFVLILSCQTEKASSATELDFCPDSATVVIKINHLSNFKSQLKNNKLLERLGNTGIHSEISEYFALLDLLQTEEQGLLALQKRSDSTTNFLFVTREQEGILDLEDRENKSMESITIDGLSFQKYQLDKRIFFSTLRSGYLLVSSSAEYLRSALDQMGRKETDPAFKGLYRASDTVKVASVFIKPQNPGIFTENLFKENSSLKEDLFSGWTSLDITNGQDYLGLSGLFTTTENESASLNLFRDTKPLSSIIPSLVPGSAEGLLAFSFGDYVQFAKNQSKYFNHKIPGDTLFRTSEEVGILYHGGKKAVVLQTYASDAILEFLQGLETGLSTYQGSDIHALRKHDFLENYFSPIITDFEANYTTVVNDAFIFTQDLELLQLILRNIKSKSTFDQTATLQSVSGSMADESSVLFIARSDGYQSLMEEEFLSEFLGDLKASDLKDYTMAGQLIADTGFHHANLVIQKITAPAKENTTSQAFTVRLDAPIATDPQFVLNHRTRRKEIVVQDESNFLYLISGEGKVIWKKQLEGRIQGKIEQVDIYKNGRLQLAFTTSNQFLILDRNGKEVAPFTKKFEGGNLNPLAVFDYEGNRNYRFVVTQGRKVFMYNSKGQIVSGFTFTEADSPIIRKPEHIRIRNRDYLVFMTEEQQLLLLSRVGKERIKVTESIEFSDNRVYLYKNNFITTDKKGNLITISEKGKLSRTRLNLAEDHGIDATIKTLAVMNDNILSIKGKEVSLELGVYTRPRIFYLYDKIYVSVTDLQSEQVYLFDSAAKSIPSFPVFGSSEIDLDDLNNDRKLELVVREGEDQLSVYRMN